MSKNNNIETKQKMSIVEIILRFFFGFLIPFVLINGLVFFLYIQCPTIKVVEPDSKDFEENKIKFSVDCKLPIKEIKVLYQDKDFAYSKANNMYVIDVTENGTYTVKATAINGAISVYNAPIESKDVTPPSIDVETVIITGNVLNITVRDDNSGINYDNLYATLENGEKISPSFVDKEVGTVQFKIETGDKIIVHVEDATGNSSETPFTIT